MRVVTVRKIELQFDADVVTSGTPEEQAEQMIRQINDAITRDPASPALLRSQRRLEIDVEEEE